MDHITELPENLLLQILSYLPVKDRCIAGRYRIEFMLLFYLLFEHSIVMVITDYISILNSRAVGL